MRVALAMAAWIVSLLPRDGVPARTLPGIEDEAFSQACVRAHNKFRSEVSPRASDMLYMTWDPALARIAKAWARKCRFEHNGQLHSKTLHPNFTSVGENIWTGSVSIFSVSSAITSWYDEVHDYDFQTQKCNKVCGHYTQVVWADSYKVGCAVQYCPTVAGLQFSNAAHFICNYGPGREEDNPGAWGTSQTSCRKHLQSFCGEDSGEDGRAECKGHRVACPWPVSSGLGGRGCVNCSHLARGITQVF
ncbi:glioma pathogenesis-related protein 1 isoform X3 [Canis aureus]